MAQPCLTVPNTGLPNEYARPMVWLVQPFFLSHARLGALSHRSRKGLARPTSLMAAQRLHTSTAAPPARHRSPQRSEFFSRKKFEVEPGRATCRHRSLLPASLRQVGIPTSLYVGIPTLLFARKTHYRAAMLSSHRFHSVFFTIHTSRQF